MMKTKSGRVLSDADVERLAAKAERGFDLSRWKPRRGRPRLDARATGHSPRVGARVSPALYARATARAAREGRTISEVVRGLLEEYAPEPRRAPRTTGRFRGPPEAPARGRTGSPRPLRPAPDAAVHRFAHEHARPSVEMGRIRHGVTLSCRATDAQRHHPWARDGSRSRPPDWIELISPWPIGGDRARRGRGRGERRLATRV